jgi:hypothetical protein
MYDNLLKENSHAFKKMAFEGSEPGFLNLEIFSFFPLFSAFESGKSKTRKY